MKLFMKILGIVVAVAVVAGLSIVGWNIWMICQMPHGGCSF